MKLNAGRQSHENEQTSGAPTTITIQENVKEVHDLVLASFTSTMRNVLTLKGTTLK